MFLSFTICSAQTKKQELKIIDTVSYNRIVTLTNPKVLTDSEYASITFHSEFRDERMKDQCFRLKLNEQDTAYFYMDVNDGKGYGIDFFIKLNDNNTLRLPTFQDYGIYLLEKLQAVSFDDINADGYTDIIVLGQFFKGYGSMESKYEPQYLYEIYFGSPRGFVTEKNLMYKLETDQEKELKIVDIKSAYLKNSQKKSSR